MELGVGKQSDEFSEDSLICYTKRHFRHSFKSKQAKEVLAEVSAKRGFPRFLRSDNGSEVIAEIIRDYLAENKIEAAFIEPGERGGKMGKATRFNGKFRDECLRMEVFGNRREAAVIAESWSKFYSRQRPHSSLGYGTPEEFGRDWETEQALLHEKSNEKLAANGMAQGLGA